MAKIALLPEQLINQIAAGEVVERPASVVKELLENSIDAGAKRIVVTVRQGGVGLIRVSDDGAGMSPEDALLSLERHATSKIRLLEDLQAIKSMGFRGEALASIASVSLLTMRTRRAEDPQGWELYLEGGKLLRQAPVGCAPGTEIEVAALFYNTLPRLKFLKSEQTEYQNVLDTVINAAMAFPQIAFKLVQESPRGDNSASLIETIDDNMGVVVSPTQAAPMDSRVALDLPATGELSLRLRGLLGKTVSDDLLEIYYGGVNLAIRGYIGKPQLSRSNRSLQYFFVNGRPINSHVLSYAVKQAYHSLLPKERYPVFAIFFELDPSMVDVNCHPRKTEVKFRDEREVYRVLLQSCRRALEKAVLTPTIDAGNLNYYQDKLPQGLGGRVAAAEFQALARPEAVRVGLDGEQSTMAVAEPPHFNDGPGAAAGLQESHLGPLSTHTSTNADGSDNMQLETVNAGREELQPLGQLDNSFILCQRGHDLVIIDQHAAHERIRYNRLISDAQCEEKAIQPLLMPISVDVSPADRAVLDANKTVLEEVGLGLEHFGGNTFAINEVPSYLVKTDLEKVLLGLIDDLKTLREHDGQRDGLSSHKGDLASRREKALTYLACRSAVKFGDALGQGEITALIDQLNRIPSGQMTCPHGRPIMLVLEKSELYSRFGRKYSGFFEQENFRDVNC